jgi:hypothetical protein
VLFAVADKRDRLLPVVAMFAATQALSLEMKDSTMTTTRKRFLLSDGDTNTKLRKNGAGFITGGMSLSPEKSAGIGNTCPHASPGCAEACLDHQGLASVWKTIGESRRAKTVLYYKDRERFLAILRGDIHRYLRRAERQNKRLAIRLNVFSDVAWENHGIPQLFPEVQFYDYTKNPGRAVRKNLILPNYHVTFSRSEVNENLALDALARGCNVSVVFADRKRPFVGNRSHLQRLPKTWRGFRVVDGDISDLRFEDPNGRLRGCVVGLRLKAHSYDERDKGTGSGFAVSTG